jgi:nitrogen fixation protein NifU and related proteins
MNNPYHHTLMDHYRYPRNKRQLDNADFGGYLENVQCGDSVRFAGRLCTQRSVIIELAFQGTGCVLSQAVASLISEYFIGRAVTQVGTADEQLVMSYVGAQLGPTRLKCALLPLQALQQAVRFCKESGA